jgi:hypothetical protein
MAYCDNPKTQMMFDNLKPVGKAIFKVDVDTTKDVIQVLTKDADTPLDNVVPDDLVPATYMVCLIYALAIRVFDIEK